MNDQNMDFYENNTDEEARMRRRAARRAEMKRKKKQQMMIRKMMKAAVPVLALLLVLLIGKKVFFPGKSRINDAQTSLPDQNVTQENVQKEGQTLTPGSTEIQSQQSSGGGQSGDMSADADGAVSDTDTTGALQEPASGVYTATEATQMKPIPEEVVSDYAILVDDTTHEIVAQRNAKTIINPASMTKVLTVLVAAEQISEAKLDDTFTITQEITDFSFRNDCSNVGFEVGEVVTVRDLFYGTILPSGADAAVGLAEYVAGSQDEFVKLMNAKLDELGLSGSAHFTNCVGLYDENHYCSVYDMAMILEAALDQDFCREVLSAHVYTTTPTEQHPEGLILSNWFLRRIEDKDAGGFVLAGKTGYVVQSGNCAASCALDADENRYICVTGNSTSSWRCIYDHVAIYKTLLPQK